MFRFLVLLSISQFLRCSFKAGVLADEPEESNVCTVPGCIDDQANPLGAKQVHKDVVDLAHEKIDLAHEQDDPNAVESYLREAHSLAPWLYRTNINLANHLRKHPSRNMREMMELFRAAHEIRITEDEDGYREEHVFPRTTYPGRLRHDRDQLTYLGERGKLPQSLVEQFVNRYNVILNQVEDEMEEEIELPEDFYDEIMSTLYEIVLYLPSIEPLRGPALNPDLDFAKIEQNYLNSHPNIATIDQLLTEEALVKLRQYYEEGMVFWDATGPGYIGSYLQFGGFGNVVVAQLIEELAKAFPKIICSHHLRTAWAYKYDGDIRDPIATHADEAAINFNLWISPNDGNLDPEPSGGLVVYKVETPEGTPRSVYNAFPLHDEVGRMLSETNYANVTVPYQSNRAVVFQSNLFHQSDKMIWSSDYTKRRINLTLLFGDMYDKCQGQ